jgi:hypothetical protein
MITVYISEISIFSTTKEKNRVQRKKQGRMKYVVRGKRFIFGLL